MNYKFPNNFYWGSAISAHQTEGNNQNSDWYAWEMAGNIAKKEVSGIACDHQKKYKEDIQIAKKLHQNMFRFSIEWAKIQPTKNSWSYEAIKHYQDVINYCNHLQIQPFITLNHFTLPKWFSDMGGWEQENAPSMFCEYVEKISAILEKVSWWSTINEPEILALQGYLRADWPPQKRSLKLFWKVYKNLIASHNASYKIIKIHQPKAKIGIIKNNVDWDWKYWPIDTLICKFIKYYWNDYIIKNTKNDFLGLNYYMHNKVHLGFKKPFIVIANENKITSDLGWEVYPQGIYHVLMDLKKYNLPIIITENGIADSKDELRGDFIVNHLYWIKKAIDKGVDVQGYLHWSLLDNFEWKEGFTPRFGLVKINYKTQERTIRKSAKIYANIAKNNALPADLIQKSKPQ